MYPLAGRGSVCGPLGASPVILTRVIILDQFTDTDGVILPNHAIAPTNTPGAVWTTAAFMGGDLAISSNVAADLAGGAKVSHLNSGVSDCVISVNLMNLTAFRYFGLAFRTKGFVADVNNNYWRADLYTNGNTLRIVERNAGVETIRATAVMTVTQNVYYTLTVTLSGQTITATVGSTTISYGSAAFQATSVYHGLYGIADSRWDNFQITA